MFTIPKNITPSSRYDQLKVAQFALKETWFESKDRESVPLYPWGIKNSKMARLFRQST